MQSSLKDYDKPQAAWKGKLHEVIYEADTPMGKLFDVILLIFILTSVVLVMMESITRIGTRYADFFLAAEWVITIFFTIEYILRIICIRQPSRYIFSFMGIIDFVSTIPLYLAFVLSGANVLLAVRSLRLLRVFRILKVTRYIGESNKLVRAIRDSGPKIAVFLFAVLILSVIAGTLMYMIEGEASGFTSIPTSVYWCIVTLTTVGFGDIAPVTAPGQFLAALIMIMGYGIIAVPTGIVSAEYTKDGRKKTETAEKPVQTNTQSCANCMNRDHRDGAHFCWKCGYQLHG